MSKKIDTSHEKVWWDASNHVHSGARLAYCTAGTLISDCKAQHAFNHPSPLSISLPSSSLSHAPACFRLHISHNPPPSRMILPAVSKPQARPFVQLHLLPCLPKSQSWPRALGNVVVFQDNTVHAEGLSSSTSAQNIQQERNMGTTTGRYQVKGLTCKTYLMNLRPNCAIPYSVVKSPKPRSL